MNNRFGWGRAVAISLLLAFVAIVAGMAVAWSFLPLDHTTISIDDETVRLSGIEGWRIAVAIAAASAGALIVGVLAVVFALLAAALSIVAALAIVIATLALVASPILVLAWAIWRLTRSTNDARPAAAY